MSAWQLSGGTALITGAARGIGAEAARHLAGAGMNVSLVGLEPERLAEVEAELGPRAAAFEADVTDRARLRAAVEGTVERFGAIDVVIANAGIAAAGPVALSDPEAFERVIEINVLGVYRTVHECLPQVMERRGYVLIVASLAAIAHAPGMAAYSTSKAGVEAFGDSLRQELRHHGVDVGVGYFSWIDTEMVRGGDRHPAFGKLRAELPAFARRTYPVSDVGRAIAAGVRARSRVVAVPSWIKGAVALSGAVQRVTELGAGDSAQQLEERFASDVAQRGAEASKPVGAGGAAASP